MRKVVIRFLVLAIALCGVCGFLVGCNQENKECTNHVEKWLTDKQATCLEQGIKHAECENCGKYLGVQSIDALGHSFLNYVLDNNATCEENGTKTATCENEGCSEKDTKTIENSALDHSYGDWVSNGNGTHTRVCIRDSKHTETKNCTGGTATCTEKAICKDCGKAHGDFAEHPYSSQYTYNATHHWQDSTCDCGVKKNLGEHTPDSSGFCYACELPINSTEGLIFDISSNGTYAEVVAYSGYSTKVNIASTYQGLPVKTIYKESFENSSIEKIIIPDSVTSIGDSAFRYCRSLTSVTIGNSVTSIGDDAFYSCSKLTSITVEENNVNYKSIDGNLYSKDGRILIQYAIGKKSTSFTIPNSVTSIVASAFSNCSSLTSIEIPNSVISIGDSAFDSCSSLTSVTIGNSVTSIGNSAFDSCSSLTSVTIGNSVTSIGNSAFDSCSSLTSVTIGNSVTSIGNSAFIYCDALTSVTIGNSVTSIGSAAFYGCNASLYTEKDCIKYVKANNNPYYVAIGVTTKNLSSYSINDNTKIIAGDAFANCDRLSSITIPNSVTSIGNSAFCDCDSLTSVTIGNSVTSIGNYAFYSCSKLTSITIGNSVTSIGDYAFSNCDALTSVEIPNSVTSIGNCAFRFCDALTSVTIGNSVTSIGDSAFYNCALTSIEIPNSVTSIGDSAFYDCYRLTKVNYLGTIDSWAQIEFGDYYANPLCYANNLYINDVLVKEVKTTTATKINAYAFYDYDSLTSVVIGDSVTSIGGYAFRDCDSLTSVVIGDNVTSIGSYAFYYCSSLTSIKYRGSESQWQAIAKGSFWDESTGNYTITYNYTGE